MFIFFFWLSWDAFLRLFNLSKFEVHPGFKIILLVPWCGSLKVPMVLPPLGGWDLFYVFKVLPILEWYWSELCAVFWSSVWSRESNFFLLGGFLIVWNLFQVFFFVATIYVIPIWRECGVSGLLPVCLLYFCFGAIRILSFFEIIIRLVWIVFHLNSVWVVLHTRKKNIFWGYLQIFLVFSWGCYNSALVYIKFFFFSFLFLILILYSNFILF